MTEEINKISFKNYLSEIYDNPKRIHKNYKLFHNYSFYNTILAESQLSKSEPINTYIGWKKIGRQVKKRSKAIKLLLPVKYNKEIDSKNDNTEKEVVTLTKFIKKPYWFSLSQTEGKEFKEVELPNFNINKSLDNLGIKKENFSSIKGGCQGYALPNENIIAINPLAFAPYKTTFHEIAHCLLHKDKSLIIDNKELKNSVMEFEAETVAYLVCSSLGKLEHLEYSRGYIASWMKRDDVKEENFKRSFDAANKILKSSIN